MKKLMILAVAAALLGMSLPQHTFAQSGTGSSAPSSTDQGVQGGGTGTQGTGTGSSGTGTGSSGTMNQDKGTSGTGSQAPGTQAPSQNRQGTGTSGTGTSGSGTGASSSGSAENSDYTEIKASELPAAVSTAISEKYPGYKTDKVAHNANGNTYKVTVSKGDEKQTLFFDQKGEAVKMQK